MEKFVIEGGVPLSGTVAPAGNKNAALPLLACALLTEQEVVLHNVPRIRDTQAMAGPARGARRAGRLGRGQHRPPGRRGRQRHGRRRRRSPSASARRSCSRARCWRASAPHTCRRRAATSSAAAAWTRTSTPSRRSARTSSTRSPTSASRRPTGGLQAVDFFMDEPSVMAHRERAHGRRADARHDVIRNAACEPHVQDLARMLVRMGAAIEGISSNVLTVHGVERARRLRARRQPRPHRDRLLHGARRRHGRRAAHQGRRGRRPAHDPAGVRPPRPAVRARRRGRRRARRAEARHGARPRRLPDQGRGRPVAGVPGRPDVDRRRASPPSPRAAS